MQRPCALPHPIEMGKKSTWFPPPIPATMCTVPPMDRVGKEVDMVSASDSSSCISSRSGSRGGHRNGSVGHSRTGSRIRLRF
jgi:hypothetical protein